MINHPSSILLDSEDKRVLEGVSIKAVDSTPAQSQQTAEVARLIVSDVKFKYFQLVANRHSRPGTGWREGDGDSRLD